MVFHSEKQDFGLRIHNCNRRAPYSPALNVLEESLGAMSIRPPSKESIWRERVKVPPYSTPRETVQSPKFVDYMNWLRPDGQRI